ncbi:MAG: DUF6580 family putative transport protein [Planctomycetaceae bacterium]
MIRTRFGLFAAILVYSVCMRLLPFILMQFGMTIDPKTTIYPWNFSPLPAICLFGGACFAQKRWAFFIPLSAFLIGDFAIWAVTGNRGWAFYPNQPVVYGSVALIVVLGFLLRERRSVPGIAGTGLLAATLFFLITNFGVWALGTTYPKDIAGLLTCYAAGLPFFGRSVASMMVFSAVLFAPVMLTRPATATAEQAIVTK